MVHIVRILLWIKIYYIINREMVRNHGFILALLVMKHENEYLLYIYALFA